MKTLALLLAAVLAALGQASLTLSSPAAVVPAGQPVTLNVTLVSGGGPAALQFGLTGLPTAGLTITTPVATKAMNCGFPAGITPVCLIVAPPTGQALTQANGLAAIPDGIVGTVTYTQPAATPATITIPAAGVLAASPAGAAVTLTSAATPVTVGIQSRCDINGDGKVDATDVGLISTAALAGAPGITVLDSVRVILAMFGGTCLR